MLEHEIFKANDIRGIVTGDDVQWDPRPYTVKIPVAPKVPAGAYPGDDAVFPVIWERPRVAAE